jgi:hypothetical protein
MKSVRRLWMSLLVGLLLMATVVGVASARPDARPQQQAWRVLAIPSTFCGPQNRNTDFQHAGNSVKCVSGTCHLVCPVHFPAAGEQAVGAVNVKRLTMFVYDNWSGETATAQLSKSYSPTGSFQGMATAGSVDKANNPQAAVDTSIDYNPVYRTQGPFIWLVVNGDNIRVNGFFVHYTW